MKKFSLRIFYVDVLIISFFSIFSALYPLIPDDFLRSSRAALSDLSLFYRSFFEDYCIHTGRIFAQLLSYIVLDKNFHQLTLPLITIINGFCCVMLMHLTYYCCFLEKPNDKKSGKYAFFCFVLILFFRLIPTTYELFLRIVAIQYLWGATFLWYLFVHYLNPTTVPPTKTKIFTLMVLGVFLGTYNEIMSACFLLVGIYKLLNLHPGVEQIYLKNKAFSTLFKNWRLASFLSGYALGAGILLLAPGNYVRKQWAQTITGTLNLKPTVWEQLGIAFKKYYAAVPFKLSFTFFVLGMFLCTVAYALSIRKDVKSVSVIYPLTLIIFFFFSIALLSPMAWYYEGWIGGRVTLIQDMLLFITALNLINTLFPIITPATIQRFLPKLQVFSIFPLVLFLFSLFCVAYPRYRFDQEKLQCILSEPNRHNKDFVFQSYCHRTFFERALPRVYRNLLMRLIEQEPNSHHNTFFANYYGIRSVRELPCPQNK